MCAVHCNQAKRSTSTAAVRQAGFVFLVGVSARMSLSNPRKRLNNPYLKYSA